MVGVRVCPLRRRREDRRRGDEEAGLKQRVGQPLHGVALGLYMSTCWPLAITSCPSRVPFARSAHHRLIFEVETDDMRVRLIGEEPKMARLTGVSA